MPSSNEIRQAFLDYFIERHDHRFAPPVPLPAVGDPSLLFVNSGMVQFKDIFLGTAEPAHPRVCNSQKCLRVSGKHNDLEDVGRDTYHHTFFEMLGYWSFGDYFKAQAIPWLWTLLTDVWGLPKDRLYATVFGGDDSDGLDRDAEAADLWAETTDIDPEHIQFWGKKDNFWEMGERGPCGPCSEVHIDLTPDGSGADLVNADDPRVIELGNIVFMQYNRGATGELSPLPHRHVDFGGGLERIVAVLQGKTSNYDTDLFQPIFEGMRDLSGARPYGGGMDDTLDIAYRVIADHLRCVTFAVTDGVTPSNEGGGYVLRRILRRAVRHGRQAFGVDEPFLHRLAPVVVELMGGAFPELRERSDRVQAILREEEESFGRTLGRGIELFEEAAERAEAMGGKEIPGDDAFKLHDTYGFPLDLTQVMATERGMTVDVEGFSRLMEGARELARSAGGGALAVNTLVEVTQKHTPPASTFLGYETCAAEVTGTLFLCRLVDGERYERSERAGTGDEVALALPETPFYAESGGQVGDTGSIAFPEGATVRVHDTQRVGGAIFHLGTVADGVLAEGEVTARCEVDEPRRSRILGNHTGTHMMNLAFRHNLGDHVEQKGSLVDDERLRFDLSHPQPVSIDELERIEDEVNTDISRDLRVHDLVVPLEDAMRIRNLRAVFGEKYPPEVRVVAIGVSVEDLVADPDDERWDDYSIELCGGTHLRSTAEARAFVFTSEEAVAKGIRRVTALTGDAARAAQDKGTALVSRVAELERAHAGALASGLNDLGRALSDETVPAVVKARLREQVSALQRRLKDHETAQTGEEAATLADEILALGDGDILIGRVSDADGGVLRKAVEEARGRRPSAAICVGSASGDTVSFVAAVPREKQDRLKAGDWIRETVAAAGGRGGGRPDIAQGGAKDPQKLDEALEVAMRTARTNLG